MSLRARDAIVVSGITDFEADDAAERLLAVHGCGRKTLKEIAAWLAQSGSKLGGFGRERAWPSTIPTMTTDAAASPRPRPLSATAKAARVPQSPESLVGARSERVHVQKGKLIAAVPIKLSKPK